MGLTYQQFKDVCADLDVGNLPVLVVGPDGETYPIESVEYDSAKTVMLVVLADIDRPEDFTEPPESEPTTDDAGTKEPAPPESGSGKGKGGGVELV